MTKEGHPLQIIEGLPERRALAVVVTQGEPGVCLSSLSAQLYSPNQGPVS